MTLTTSLFLWFPSNIIHPYGSHCFHPPILLYPFTMVSMTRAEAKDAFNHVLNTVLGRGDSSSLKSSLLSEGISDIFDLTTLTDDTIESLTHEDPDKSGNFYPIKKGDKMILRCFIAYHRHLESQLGDFDYKTITQADFDTFRISPECRSSIQPRPVPTLSTPTSPKSMATSNASRSFPVAMFRRSVKKDPSLFPTLKDDEYFGIWYRSFNTQAAAQDVAEVLDESYVPITADDIALFAEKQKYVYAVLKSKVSTDRGKSIISEHDHDFDAQKVYQKLKEYHLTSTKAEASSSLISSCINPDQSGDGIQNGTTESFTTNGKDQVRLHEKNVPTSYPLSDGRKQSMILNAVEDKVKGQCIAVSTTENIGEVPIIAMNQVDACKIEESFSMEESKTLCAINNVDKELDPSYSLSNVEEIVFDHSLPCLWCDLMQSNPSEDNSWSILGTTWDPSIWENNEDDPFVLLDGFNMDDFTQELFCGNDYTCELVKVTHTVVKNAITNYVTMDFMDLLRLTIIVLNHVSDMTRISLTSFHNSFQVGQLILFYLWFKQNFKKKNWDCGDVCGYWYHNESSAGGFPCLLVKMNQQLLCIFQINPNDLFVWMEIFIQTVVISYFWFALMMKCLVGRILSALVIFPSMSSFGQWNLLHKSSPIGMGR